MPLSPHQQRVTAFLLVLTLSGSVHAITFGQIDTFQDGTVMDWQGAQPQNIGTGGPAGTGDRFLKITSVGGTGQNSHLAAKNGFQWSGNYLLEGVYGVTLDLLNMGTATLEIRAVIFDVSGSRWSTIGSRVLAPSPSWQQASFQLNEPSMVRVDGGSTYSFAMENATQIMFRHDPDGPSAGGTSIATSMGLDNIRAVPEPGTWLALCIGAIGLVRIRQARRVQLKG